MAQMTLSSLLAVLRQQKGGPAGGRPIAGPLPALTPSQPFATGHPVGNLSAIQQQSPHTLATALAQARAAHSDPHKVLDSSSFKPDPSVVPEGLTEFKAKYGDSPGGWEAAYERRQKRLALGIHLGPTDRQSLGTGGAAPGPGGVYGQRLQSAAAAQPGIDEALRQAQARRARRLGLL